jgi:ferredoxin/flavodoxin
MSKSIGIFYFSGTGNTRIVADLFAKEFKNKGCAVEIFAIDDILKNNINIDMEKYDIFGFGYPVHAFNAPRFFFDFVKILPTVKQKKTFVFKSSGDPFFNGGSNIIVRNRLMRKGYDVFNESLFVMPANVLLRYPDEMIKQLYNTAADNVKIQAGAILSGVVYFQKNSLFLRVATVIFSGLESSGARFFGKDLVVSKSCTLCEICVKKCPTSNIHRREKTITFGLKCTLCMRCMYACPEKAISPRFLKFFMIKNWYDFQKIINDSAIKGMYISSTTKGYFKHYYQYLTKK